MSFHKSRLGQFGDNLPCDLDGYVPEEGDKPEDFRWEDDDFTEDFDAQGNGYDGCAADLWSAFVEDAVAQTAAATKALAEWRREGEP